MLCLRSLASYLLAAAAFGCFSANPLLSGPILQTNDTTPEGSSHRGSGRIVTQEALTRDAIAFRGTGRFHTPGNLYVISHRGSGRIDDQTTDSGKSAYRGSGRISPHPLQTAEFA
jgi:hypothetical protein